MKKNIKSTQICTLLTLSLAICSQSVYGSHFYYTTTVYAAEASDTTMQGASVLQFDENATCLFASEKYEAHYFKFTVPNDIGNQWITFSATNYTNKTIYATLLDSIGTELVKEQSVKKEQTYTIDTKIEGSESLIDSSYILVPGNTYYIKLRDKYGSKITGNASVSIKSLADDNWGTFPKAVEFKPDEWQNGKLEKADDIDCFFVTLPDNNSKYTFNISCDNSVNVKFLDENRANLSELTVDANNTSNKYSVTGHGQTIYVKVKAGNNKINTANYSIKASLQKETNNNNNSSNNNNNNNNNNNDNSSNDNNNNDNNNNDNSNSTKKKKITTLSLKSYKKGTKKVIGKTIKAATVKVKVSGNTYTVKSNNTGKFTAKLVAKLKSGTKITVIVSKKNYITCTRKFFVK